MKRFLNAAVCLLLIFVLSLSALAAAPAEASVFYPQLPSAGKEIYDTLSLPENLEKLRAGEKVEVSFVTSASAYERDLEEKSDLAIRALATLTREHTELFWIKGISIKSEASIGVQYKVTMYLSLQSYREYETGARSNEADMAAVRGAVERIASEAAGQGSRYAQMLYVHDWLTQHNIYNTTAASSGAAAGSLPWSPLSALTDESQPVCEGYSRAFKLLCDALGIPCILVDGVAGGELHMWNQVMLDGKWYAVDVTFDDPIISGVRSPVSGYEDRDYFLVGADTVIGGEAFSASHVAGVETYSGVRFTYPALSAAAYDPNAAKPSASGFTDVKDDDYFADAVLWAKETGVTDGTSATTFSPANPVKRGQAVTFLWRAMHEPEPASKENPFSDVKESDYFYKAVLWAVEMGITDGTTETTFSPENPVTRGQMITFLWRTLGRPGETGIGVWYEDPENWAGAGGYLSGTAEAYTTGANCPRGDVVYYLWQAVA